MIKKIIKFSLIVFFFFTLVIVYLSVFGIKTDKLNSKITSNISKINNKINLKLSDVKYSLNLFNFTINVKTEDPKILLEGRSLGINNIQTIIPLKSFLDNKFLIDDLQIKTEEIKYDDLIALIRIFKNSTQLFVLDTVLKDGYIVAKINLNFNEKGEIKQNYKISGSVKKIKIDILNQLRLKNLNFNFNIDKDTYLLKKIETQINDIEITSPIIEIKKKKNYFFVNGQFLNKKKNFNIKEIKSTFNNLLDNTNIKKVEFSSKNDFSFNINKDLKFDNLKIKSTVDLSQFIINEKDLKLKPYFPNFDEEINFEKHKIVINYYKNDFNIKGAGNILLNDKIDKLTYNITKKDKNILFDSKINFKNNSLLLEFLDYKKKEGLNSTILLKGIFKKK
jgi:hypothetical protein